MRLDKFVSHCTDLSRKKSRAAIKSKRISVNGETVTDFSLNLQNADTVQYQQETLSLPGLRYYMLHKPADVICATTDPNQPCVVDLIEDEKPGLKVAGRLDKDSTGLVLLSDDGNWIHKIISPNAHCEKIYWVDLDLPLTDTTIEHFSNGILLNGETKVTRPATVKAIDEAKAEVTIGEGRYHQVKRMFAACGNHVKKLHRHQVGDIVLDHRLAPGQYRPLTATEISSINKS